MAVFAQETPQRPDTPAQRPDAPVQRPDTPAQRPDTRAASPAQQTPGGGQQITVTGCIQREADYRKAQDKGRGGVAGTGIGAGNEFVLVNASMSAGAGRAAGAPTGTAGSTAAYELTGKNEGEASAFVGKRVEISGMLKAAEESAAGRPTGGPTAGKPPEGVDVLGGDLKLRELEVTSVKESPGTCPTP
jgi:hypothetical protein